MARRAGGLRRAVTAFFALCMRVFFRRIELVGTERIPENRPVIFAVNHPNGLIDPLFLLCHAPRPVSFLAKAPLFRYFFIGTIVRAFDAIPVYRKQDASENGGGGSNRETFEHARDVLRRGGAIAIFPEGTTHDDSRLRELKTGAARIALGSGLDMVVVPTGIYYTAKHMFRSSALVVFGEPLGVQPSGVDAEGEPPSDVVDRLTASIDAGLDSVTVQADSRAALDVISVAEDIFSADEDQPLIEEFDLRRRFEEGYRYLRATDPHRLHKLESAIHRLVGDLRRAGLDVHELKPGFEWARALRLIVLSPLAAAGAVTSYVQYRIVGMLATRFAKGEDAMVATMKFLAALAVYPLSFLLLAIAIGWRLGIFAGVASLVLLPVFGYCALVAFEDLDDVVGDLRAMVHRLVRTSGYERLVARRRKILSELVDVSREMDGQGRVTTEAGRARRSI
jgi:1-acyl-sn-glycerol-3-phosphate acyltransferase